jgi:hypothetical protein
MPTTILTTTSSTRPGSPSAGDAYFETDTKNYIIYDGANWRGYNSDGVSGWSGSNTYSLNFDGTDDYLTAASIVTPTAQQGTISAWVKSTTTSFSPIFNISSNTNGDTGYWTGLQFSGGSPGKLEFGHRPNAGDYILYTSASTYNDGNWHHVMVTTNGSAYKLFIDGAEDTGATASGTNNSNVVGGWIGDMAVKNSCNIGVQRRNADSTNGYFSGNIDEVAVWDSDQSSNISTIYNSGTPGNLLPLNPNHWWRMGDGAEGGSGSTVYDMSLGSVNATIVNQANFDNTTAP